MGKSITLLATILVICALLVGGIAGYAFHPDTKEVIRNVAGPEVKVPVEVIKEVTKEVIKEVP
ncbi:MAG: hypothetical protein IMZ51_04085, partial [Chloroflexi bacterium]|nr:hypothetical protein [Chloroflexota bacterium]